MFFFIVGHFQTQHLPSIQNQDQLSESFVYVYVRLHKVVLEFDSNQTDPVQTGEPKDLYYSNYFCVSTSKQKCIFMFGLSPFPVIVTTNIITITICFVVDTFYIRLPLNTHDSCQGGQLNIHSLCSTANKITISCNFTFTPPGN